MARKTFYNTITTRFRGSSQVPTLPPRDASGNWTHCLQTAPQHKVMAVLCIARQAPASADNPSSGPGSRGGGSGRGSPIGSPGSQGSGSGSRRVSDGLMIGSSGATRGRGGGHGGGRGGSGRDSPTTPSGGCGYGYGRGSPKD